MKTLFFQQDPAVAFALTVLTLSSKKRHHAIAWASILIALCLFYRDEDRTDASSHVVSPCDGTVLTADDQEIVIFLSPLDMHTQKCVADCSFVERIYKPGEFYPAMILEKTQYNEKMTTMFKLKDDSIIEIDQISGQIARRIANWAEGDMKKGETFGMIKFGSQCRVRSQDRACAVRPGDKVRAGQTVIFYNAV
jgi:phosphatidylserine decarboxylase